MPPSPAPASVAPPRALPLPPGPPRHTALQVLGAFQQDALGLLLRLVREHGDVVRIPVGPRTLYLVAHPDGVRRVLQDNARNYTKQTRGFAVVRELLGAGLLTSEGELWLRQRRLVQPAFHRQRLAAFGRVMVEVAGALADEWEPQVGSGRALDVSEGMGRLALAVASRTLFGTDVSDEARAIGEALRVALHYANTRITRAFPLPRFLPTPMNRRAARARATLDGVVRGIIERRRREGAHAREDVLSLLMEARDEETGEAMSDTQLRDEVMTLLLAGHETSAASLCWTWALLSLHPGVRRRLEAEWREVLAGRAPTPEDMPRLVYTRCVVDESLRLYPPAWVFSRAPSRDDEVQGFRLPAGRFVLLSPYVMHRHPRLWDNPEGFDPERFRPEAAAAHPRFAYFPFGGGPRQCIGNHFALLELVLVLATLGQRLRLELVPGLPPVPEATITLRPRGRLLMSASRPG